ncbi:competence protein CoiA [Lactococcus kimchii]|uniref:competence protein CoiA n=1 Tax=Lactococcus sp. S-13 TaxID=2507158 RepID=UPI0010235D34|nr:competence protein CoiA family protein [Lactococcus sp. S-13]RZI48934.1 competence protein CoiA [Lactococcus sp. S-13]
MLTAFDENKKLINLLENRPESLKGKYFCPACRSELSLKNGAIKTPHFAHKSLQACDLALENESAQHLGLKKELYEWFKQDEKVEIERYLPALNQRPDLLVNDKIAIEIQCSYLSLKRLKERSENYRQHGYRVLWLMGKDLWMQERLTELQKNLLYFSENRGFYYWELDLEKQKLRLKSLIHEDLQGHLLYLTDEFSFKKAPLLSLLRRPYQRQKLQSITVPKGQSSERFIRQQLFHRSAKWLKIQEIYYQKGENLLTKNFQKSFFAPPGLNLLTVSKLELPSVNFCQITQNISEYYQNFWENFTEKYTENLYPPRFYAIMKERENEKNQVKA